MGDDGQGDRPLAELEALLRLGIVGGASLTKADAHALLAVLQAAEHWQRVAEVCGAMLTTAGIPRKDAADLPVLLPERVAALVCRCRALASRLAARPDAEPGAAAGTGDGYVIRLDIPQGRA